MRKHHILILSLLVCSFLCAMAAAVCAGGKVPALRITDGKSTVITAPHSGELNTFQKQRIEKFLSGMAAPLDTLRLVALQVQFSDSLFGGQPGSLRSSPRDSTWFANELEHMAEYFRGASRGRTEIVWTLEGKIYHLPDGMGYYGDDDVEDARVVELMETLVDSADADVDFSLYNTVFVIHAGAGQETDVAGDSPELLWSGFYDLGDIRLAAEDDVPGILTGDSLDGEPFYLDHFSIVPEDGSQDYQTIGSLGIWAFEVGTRLGLVPMFDATPPGFSDSQGTGNFCLMAYGLFLGPQGRDGFVPGYPCVFNRMIAGWVDPVTIDAGTAPQSLALADLNSGSDADTVCIKIPITENEYYLVVNRVHDTNFDSLFTFGDNDSDTAPENTDSFDGAEFDYFLTYLTNPTFFVYDDRYGFDVEMQHTGSGIYVWHIDENVVRQNSAAGHLPNDFVDRKGVDLEEADGVQDLDAPGYIGFMLGSYFDAFRSGDGNAATFGPDTKPDTRTNNGAPTGILIDNVSAAGPRMTFELSRSPGYEEVRKRWIARGPAQPATAADIDGDSDLEIIVLADTGRVYVFNADGTEYDDADADPSTIDPYITVPDAIWTGPPALGDLDAVPGDEIVAAAADGRVFAWKGNGDELTDGDGDALTDGVLYDGFPIAAPVMLVPSPERGSGELDVVIVQRENNLLHVIFVRPTGVEYYVPGPQPFNVSWPLSVQGQYAAPLALARKGIGGADGQTGIVFAWIDTLESKANVSYTPAMWSAGTAPGGQQTASGWSSSWPFSPGKSAGEQIPSAPATGDMDADGNDEVVVTATDGRVLIFDDGTGIIKPVVTELRSGSPSGPALGDIDLDGTLEIAVWDDEYMYMLKSNGAAVTNWPVRIFAESAGEQPPNVLKHELESPLIGDFDGDGETEVLYPLRDGQINGFERDGAVMDGFPRAGPYGSGATFSVAPLGAADGDLSLAGVGFLESFGFIDNVADTVYSAPVMTLSIQSLPGSDAGARLFWPAYQAGNHRQGEVVTGVPLKTVAGVAQTETFMIYPNPVSGGRIHARITLNASARVLVEIYNIEGERAFNREYSANPAGLIDTPFDETIDVSGLKSGVYFVRLKIEGDSGCEKLIKPFAIRR